MRQIKICHVIDSSNHNRLLYNSLKFSDRQRLEYTVISLAARGPLHTQMNELGVETLSIDCLSRKNYPSAIMRLARFMRKRGFDIVQVHSFEGSVVGLFAAFLARVPVRIFSGHHSHEVPLYASRKLMLADGFLSKRLATHVVAWSANMRDIFVNSFHVPDKRVAVIHHGMDLDAWAQQGEAENNLRTELGLSDKIVFGTVGRLFWVKDFERLVNVFAEIARDRDDLAMLIVGEGEDRKKLEGLITSSGVTGKIFLTGKRDDIASVMNTFDVYVHTALAESFGLVLIEALALGKPIVSSRVGIAEEIITEGENGYLFEPGDTAGLSQALDRAVASRSRFDEMGNSGKAKAARFSIAETQAVCDRYYISLTGDSCLVSSLERHN
jgi:glycosyltransferase involved in cell wall biosynthesis